ncbi:MAG: acyltransferase [Leptolyngbyaceae cyanobacterium bins.302]|nr:acyltransferase [Leptolyngbyaceae cyanobacterium bins.302]
MHHHRYYWIDLAKVFSILGVIFIHSSSNEFLGLLSHYFRFSVPIFIATSFFLLERSQIDKGILISASNLWKKRLPRLLIPFFVWSFIYAVIFLQPQYPSFSKFITLHWIGFGWSGQYYLLVMVQLILLYPWLRRTKLTARWLLIAGILNILILYIPLNYFPINQLSFLIKLRTLPFFYWVFYVLLAIYVARNYESIKAGLIDSDRLIRTNKMLPMNLLRINPGLSILVAPLLIVLEEISLKTLNVNSHDYFCISVLIVSCILFFAFIHLEIVLERTFLKQWKLCGRHISWLSSWTLGVFCLNPLIISGLKATQILNFNPPSNVAIFIGIFNTLVIYTIALLLSYLISLTGAKSLVR